MTIPRLPKRLAQGSGLRLRAIAGRGLIRAGWVALAAGLALGSAGIIAATEHSPSAATRPELTWSADQVLSARLTGAIGDLTRLNGEVESLGDMARKTLSSLAQADQEGLQAAWDTGWSDVAGIDSTAADLNASLGCEAWSSSSPTELTKTYSSALIDRYTKVCRAIASVLPLHSNWRSMVGGSGIAMWAVSDIQSHDSIETGAILAAGQGRYADALARLSGAEAAIVEATAIADSLSSSIDVSTLSGWLSRIAAYDDALGVLWQTLIDSNGIPNDKVVAALRSVRGAEAMLPHGNDVLQISIFEMAGYLTRDGIAIETAKGALGEALTDVVNAATTTPK